MSEVTAADAMARANEAYTKVEGHEDLCAERYEHIQTLVAGVSNSVGELKKIIGWGGSVLFTIIVALLSFFAVRAVNTNDSELTALKAQVEVMKAQQVK